MKLSIKNIRTFVGHEGPGYNASLYVDGVKAALAIDEGNGGAGYQHFQDRDMEKRVHAAAKAAPKELVPYDFEHLGQIIDKLIENTQNHKRFKKICSTRATFRLKGDKAGTYWTLNAPITRPGVREALRKHYADKQELDYILNDKLDEIFPLEIELAESPAVTEVAAA